MINYFSTPLVKLLIELSYAIIVNTLNFIYFSYKNVANKKKKKKRKFN